MAAVQTTNGRESSARMNFSRSCTALVQLPRDVVAKVLVRSVAVGQHREAQFSTENPTLWFSSAQLD